MTNRFIVHDAEYIGMEFTEKQLYEAIHRLCHFVPIDSADNLCSAVHDFLVQHVMATHGVIPLKLSEVRDSLKNIFGMDFELKEVEGTLKRLHKAKKVVYSKEKYRLDLIKCNELRKSVTDCEDRERKIIDDWLKSVATKYPELSNNDLQRLEKDLKIFAAKIFVQHGAKCADLIYANQEKRAVIVDNPEEFLSKILPKYPVLDKIRSTELPAFFRDAKRERKMYIAELLNSSFMLHAIQIDNTCSAIIQKISRGRLLYLDTNVLYALVGLSTPRDTKAVRRLIEISQQIGYVVTISTKTMGEFKSSLDYATKNLKKFPRVPKNIAKIAAIYSSGSFITAYWRKHAETNISPEDFVATYRNTKSLLAQYNIGVRDDLCAEVQDDPELKNQINMLYAAEDPTPIPMNIAEHDAFHRLLIRKLRGGKIYAFSDASAWFLTFDKKLNRFDYFARHNEGDNLSEVPFCISCDDWLQFIRPLLPRTDDFDKTFINLLSSPYFRSYGEVPTQLAEVIVNRLSQFKDHSPEVAAKILTDSLFLHQLERIDDETEQMELIDNEIVASAREFSKERDHYKKLLDDNKKAAKEVEDGKKRIEEKIKRIEGENKRIEEEKGEEQRKYLREKEKTVNEMEILKNKFELFIKYIKWSVAILIWVLIILSLILIPWNDFGGGIKLLIVCAAFFISLMVLSIPIGWGKIFKIITIIGALAHIILLINLAMGNLA